MTKILLINPPYYLTRGRFEKGAVYTEPPLGIAYIAAYLRKYVANVKVKIIDAAAMLLNTEQLLEQVRIYNPDIVGCTVVTATAEWTKEFLGGVKSLSLDTLTVVGGAHPTALPFDLFPEADISIIGEGEATMSAIVGHRQNGSSLGLINGIAYKEKGRNVITECREYINDLDTIPYPAWDLLPTDRYRHQNPYKTKTKGYATVLTGRGCPFSCTFCGVKSMWGKHPRYRSIENIIGEIDLLVKYQGVSFVFFFDDTFTSNRERTLAICKGINNFGIKWACFSRVDGLDDELLKAMKESGCVEIQIGVESGDADILKKIKKGITIESAIKTFRTVKETGINTKGFFMIGNEGETPDTVNKTIKLALTLNPTYGFFSILIPFPGLPIYECYKEAGYITTYDWGKYNWYGYPVFSTPQLTDKQMKSLQRKAELRFYLRPSKIFKYACDAIKSGKIKTLIRNMFVFINIVTYKNK
jgi:anaerobic magnesium-protoporphyrin IX monomethyl ester cyclase